MSTDPSVAPDADAEAPAEGWVGDPSAGPEPEPFAEPEPLTAAAPEVDAEAEAEQLPGREPEPEPSARAEAEPAPEAQAEQVAEAEPVAGAEAEQVAEAEPVAGAGAEQAAEAGAGSEPDPLAEAIRERDEYLDALRRLQADFENYRKRVQKQAAEQSDRATEGLVSKLLPVLDTVDLALAHASGEAEETAGLGQVATSLLEVLGKEGLVRIDALGQPFDPSEHDAVLHEEAEGSETPEVVEVLRSGWRWRERVLRPAMVKVKG